MLEWPPRVSRGGAPASRVYSPRASAARLRAFRKLPSYTLTIADMTNAGRTLVDATHSPLRTVVRGACGRAPSWTGRSALSSATDTALSRLATAGARKTRVSEMRIIAARAARCSSWSAGRLGRRHTAAQEMAGAPLMSG